MQRLYKPRACKGGGAATIKSADPEAIQIKAPQRDEKGDNTESRYRVYTNQGSAKGGGTATIKRADAEAMHIKDPQREEKGDNKESGCRSYTY